MKDKKAIILCSVALAILAIIISIGIISEKSNEQNGIKIPSSQSEYQGSNYKEVVSELKDAGFTNVDVDPIEDLIAGFLTKDGEVESVSVDGKTDYDSGDLYPTDIKVVVTYHTFPEEKESSEPNKFESSDGNKEDSTSSSDHVGNQQNAEILTTDNCEELKNLMLLKNTSDDSITEFATKYKGRTIEFDGHIANIDNHENAKTRYDILIYASDYSESDLIGPHFKFEDVGVHDLGIKDLYLPDFVSLGQDVRIIAEVEEFNSATELFMLKPISITERKKDVSADKNEYNVSEQSQVSSSISSANNSKTVASTSATKSNQTQNSEHKVYWGDTGTKIHSSSSCRTIKGDVNSGTEADAVAAGRTDGYCKVCD